MRTIGILLATSILVTCLAAPVLADDWTMWEKKKTQKSLPQTSYAPDKVLKDYNGTPVPFEEIPWLFFYHYLPKAEMEALYGQNARWGVDENGRFKKLLLFNDVDGYAGYGFYVAGNPQSSESYGDETVVSLLVPGTKMVDTTKDPGRAFFRTWLADQDAFRGAGWGDDKMKDAYSKFAEVFGLDVVYYDSGNSWLVIKNKQCVDNIIIGKARITTWGLATLDDAKASEQRKAAALVAVAKFDPDRLEARHVDWVHRDMDPLAYRFLKENKNIMPKPVKKKLFSILERIKNFFKFW